MSFKFTALYGGGLNNNELNKTELDNELNNIVKLLLQFRTDIKMYHWQTKSFPYHKISDELLSEIDDLTDKLVEASSGILKTRPNISNTNNNLIILRDVNTELFLNENNQISDILRNSKLMEYTEIANIRDEILGAIAKAKYLMTFE